MKIGIDIDDTTVSTVNPMIKYGKIFNEEVLKRPPVKFNFGEIKTVII